MIGRKPSDVGHIKPSTHGTSNEISFSVLDAKSYAAPEQNERPAWELPQEELKLRRSRRRRGRWLYRGVLTLTGIALAGAVAWLAVVNFQHQMDYVGQMKDLLQQVSDECDAAADFNNVVETALVQPIENASYAEMKQQYESSLPTAEAAAEHLAQLELQIENLQPQLQSPADNEAANQGIDIIKAQLNLVDLGKQSMEWALPAHEAYAQAQAAMQDILDADALAREATEVANDLSEETARASIEKSEESVQAFEQAADELDAAAAELAVLQGEAGAAPTNIIDLYAQYIELRIEAQQAAIQSMQAYLDRDKTILQDAADQFNELEQQAADLIADQTELPADAISAALASARQDASNQWTSESARVSVTLQSVRDYLS